jgi:phospholipid transport system substrate-binding protein
MFLVRKLLVVTLAGAGLVAVVNSENDTPNAVVEGAIVQVADLLKGRREVLATDRQALYALVDDVLLPRFDSKFAAQVVLGKHWRNADAAQRERFIAAFYQALLRRYADGVLEFDQDLIKVLPFRGDTEKRRVKVRSTVRLEDGSKVAVDYDLVKRDSGWLIFNVVVEGISYVRNFRAELDSEIRGSSLEAMIVRLEGEAGISLDE